MSIDPSMITRESVIEYMKAIIERRQTFSRYTGRDVPPLDHIAVSRLSNYELIETLESHVTELIKVEETYGHQHDLTDDLKERVRQCFTYDLHSVPFPIKED